MTSYVYAISNGKAIKIGKAVDPSKRIQELQTASSIQLSILCMIQCLDDEAAFRIENAIHAYFKDSRHLREWFTVNEDEVVQVFTFVQRCIGRVDPPPVVQVILKEPAKLNSLITSFRRILQPLTEYSRPMTKTGLILEWYSKHPEDINKPGRELEKIVLRGNTIASYRTWNNVRNKHLLRKNKAQLPITDGN